VPVLALVNTRKILELKSVLAQPLNALRRLDVGVVVDLVPGARGVGVRCKAVSGPLIKKATETCCFLSSGELAVETKPHPWLLFNSDVSVAAHQTWHFV
jgi:hypothetical protein